MLTQISSLECTSHNHERRRKRSRMLRSKMPTRAHTEREGDAKGTLIYSTSLEYEKGISRWDCSGLEFTPEWKRDVSYTFHISRLISSFYSQVRCARLLLMWCSLSLHISDFPFFTWNIVVSPSAQALFSPPFDVLFWFSPQRLRSTCAWLKQQHRSLSSSSFPRQWQLNLWVALTYSMLLLLHVNSLTCCIRNYSRFFSFSDFQLLISRCFVSRM